MVGPSPYIIDGTIYKWGATVTSPTPTVKNINTGDLEIVTANASGYYMVDISDANSNFSNGVTNGDTIRVEYLTGYTETVLDTVVDNMGTTIDVELIADEDLGVGSGRYRSGNREPDATTDTYVSYLKLDVRGARNAKITIKNTGANQIKWKILGRVIPGGVVEADVQAEATLNTVTAATKEVNLTTSGYGELDLQAKASTGSAQGAVLLEYNIFFE